MAAKGAAATKVAKGVAAKALEGVALHLRPGAMAQPVVNEGEVGRGRRRVLGWAQGGCGAGRTIGGSTFRRARSQGGSGELPGMSAGLIRSQIAFCLMNTQTSFFATLSPIFPAVDTPR